MPRERKGGFRRIEYQRLETEFVFWQKTDA